jgi:hypothetical protein
MPDLLAGDWRLWTRPGIPATVFVLEDNGALTVTARQSWGVRYRDLPKGEAPSILSWTWRVDELSVPGPPVDATHDSRPLAVHVGFDEMPDRTTFWSGLRRTVGGLLGLPAWAKVLTYSWGGLGPVDQPFVNPYFPENGSVRILQPDTEPLGAWRDERVNFREDFARAFGYPAPPVIIVAVSADMNAVRGQSRGAIRALRFGGD